MVSWIDDFEGNKLNPKWVATRISGGGQNNGVWTREVKDSKLYWKPTNSGTESDVWGEKLSLPVNVPAGTDIKVEATWRIKISGVGGFYPGVGMDSTNYVLNGVQTYAGAAGNPYLAGKSTVGATNWPGFPSRNNIPLPSDVIVPMRIVRKNGYVFLYGYGMYIGSYSNNNAISNVNINLNAITTMLAIEIWLDWIRVTPSSVVL